MNYIFLQPPVGYYSTPDEVQGWLDRLSKMEQTDEVKAAIEEANEFMVGALELNEILQKKLRW